MTRSAAGLGPAQVQAQWAGASDLALPRAAPLLACLAASALWGCAQPVRVNSLATGQPERVAYELFGHNLADLRAQASQLCPQGGDVVRAAESRQATGASQLKALHWAEDKLGRVLPPAGSAQLVVTCDAPGQQRLAALPPPQPPASAPRREPVFRLGGGDGPGWFSRLGGTVAGLWGGAASNPPALAGVDAHNAPASPGPQAARDAALRDKPGAAPVTAAGAAPKGQATNPPANKTRPPVPVSGYDD